MYYMTIQVDVRVFDFSIHGGAEIYFKIGVVFFFFVTEKF